MRIRILLVLGLALAAVDAARALEPLNPPPPLAAPPAAAAESAGEAGLTLVAAQRAQELGLPSAAAALYRQLLDTPGADRLAATLGLATALIDEGQGAEAERVLESWTGPRDAAWHLRRGLAALLRNFVTTARNERDAARIAELPPGDRGWHLFLQGSIATAENEHDKAAALFAQAVDAAVSPPARARFLLKHEEARLRGGQPATAADLEKLRKNVEQYQGRAVGYGFARSYAIMLDTLGRKADAVRVLQQQLVALPAEERGELDEMRLLLGLIAGAASGEGRDALERLLKNGGDRDKQRVALQLLARASAAGPAVAQFRKELDGLIAATPAHPVLEDLLLARAQVAVAARTTEGYAQAEDDARTLLQKFPGSPLKAQALGVLTASAWEQRRYRTAADNAVKARAELPAGAERAALGVLVAEAWFRARDFRSAADAYAAALREQPADANRGKLMFQRVLAEIAAGAPEAAVTVLEELLADPSFDAVSRWQAEWNLARALQAAGKTAEAYDRVTKLLDGAPAGAGLPAELRARMAWLQARLASAAGRPEQTIALAGALPATLEGVSPELRDVIASAAALLRAEANFALSRDAAALEILNKLRADFPRSDAAIYSFFDEAEHYAKQDKAVEAQKLLTELADKFPDNRTYAPLALFRAALQAERRGQDTNLKEANRLIEALVTKYPESDLVFTARLKQGDLLRKLNQFPQAQRVYQELANKYASRPDVALAQLALAETHNAQATNEPAHTESAMMLFEHVLYLHDPALVDARVEAGFNLGWLHLRRGEPAKAEQVWWADVVNEFLLKTESAGRLGATGRYWMARTLLELGTLYEQQEKLEQAKQAWLLIAQARLGYGEALAKARLARFGLAEARP